MRASMLVSIGVLLSSGAFLLLSLNYANTVGLFQIKSSLPAQFFATQVEALVDGIYAAPEEMTIRYSGPNTCYWDENLSEWRCQGDIRIRSVGASASFTHNTVGMGFPLTGCLYLDFSPAFLGWAKKKIKAGIEKLGKKSGEEVVEELVGEVAENTFEELAKKAGKNLDDAMDEFAERRARELAELYGTSAEAEKESVKKSLRKSISEGETTYDTQLFLEYLSSSANREMAEGSIRASLKSLASATKDQVKNFFKKGFTTVAGLYSKLGATKTILKGTLKGLTTYASCRSENPLLDIVDLLLNGQIILEWDNKIIHNFYDFYVGKTGAVSLRYVQAGREREINKLMVLNGEDMCFLRYYLAYNLTDYEFTNFPVKDGAIELSKERKLFDTLCDENSEYYPKDLFDILETIKQVERDGQTRTLTIFVNPGKMISKEGTKLCERRVKRTEDGRFNGSFVIFCYEISNLVGDDFNLTINYDNPESEITALSLPEKLIKEEGGNEYWFVDAPEVQGRFKIDSPILTYVKAIKGLFEKLDREYELDTDLIWPANYVERKDAYFQSRYDRYELRINKTGGGNIRLTPEYKGMVLGMDYNGIYTEAQLK